MMDIQTLFCLETDAVVRERIQSQPGLNFLDILTKVDSFLKTPAHFYVSARYLPKSLMKQARKPLNVL